MKFQGDIASIPITDVAQNLAANRKAGVLAIRRGEELRRIVFHDGKVVSYSDNFGFSMPQWIEDKGLADPEVLKKVLQKYRKSRRKTLGAFLEDAGVMSEEEYLSHLKSVVQEVLYETFTFRDGTFEFQENARDADALDREMVMARLELAVGPILIESARRLDDWEAIRRGLPSENDIYSIARSERSGIIQELDGDEISVEAVKLLDGSRTIHDVIAALPTTRFEAARAISNLVARKWARPLNGTELLEQLNSGAVLRDKGRLLKQLKAALEREPGNRDLLKKVAELSHEMGNSEESAVFHKLLAPALLADGDQEGAERELRQSLKLNPKDIGVWQKLYDMMEEQGDDRSLLAFGKEMSKHLRQEGLEELARDHLTRMLERFPGQTTLRVEHAETLFGLGSRAQAVEELLSLARDLMKKGGVDEAERTLAKVIEYDRDHKRAREIYDKLRSGKMAQQRAKRRSVIRGTVASLLMACMGFFIGYDFYARREFILTARQVFAEGLIERGDYKRASERLKRAQDSYPLSLVPLVEGREVLEGLEQAARHAAQKKASAPRAALPAGAPGSQKPALQTPTAQSKPAPTASPVQKKTK
jgi:tetratricopeptide (TPR) repeat protein